MTKLNVNLLQNFLNTEYCLITLAVLPQEVIKEKKITSGDAPQILNNLKKLRGDFFIFENSLKPPQH